MSCDGWESGLLGDICRITMGQSPKGSTCNQDGEGVPLLNGPTEFGDRYPVARQYTTDPKKMCDSGDLLFCVRGSTGRMNWADRPYALGRGLASLRHVHGLAFQPFLKGLVDMRLDEILNQTTGSTFPNVNRALLATQPIRYPSQTEQRAIAATLSCLDDKIELNNRINKVLEEMAQALFKNWFVDFEPFQDGEFVDSELGPIPKGWRVGRLSDVAELCIGGDWGKESSAPGLESVICLRGTDLQSLKEQGISSSAPVRWVKPNSVDKRRIGPRDILIGGSGLGPIGRSLYCADSLRELYNLPIIYSNFCKRIRAVDEHWAIYVESLIEHLYTGGELKSYMNGTSIPNLAIKDLMDRRIVVPNEETVVTFAEIKASHFSLKFSRENEELRTIRDTLLPKLMSGEVRVPLNSAETEAAASS